MERLHPGLSIRFSKPFEALMIETVIAFRLAMTSYLLRLAKAFPELGTDQSARFDQTNFSVGWYPCVNGDLRSLDAPGFVAGKARGLFHVL